MKLKKFLNEEGLFKPIDISKIDIEEILERLKIEKYKIRKDGKIDVFQDIKYKLPFWPIKFGIVSGDFDCYGAKLKNLDGAPEYVKGDFACFDNELISLKGSPEYVYGDFDCSFNKLISLEGSPKYINGNFQCSHNKLTTLKGAPKYVDGSFSCSFNQLTTLEGAPKYVRGSFNISKNLKKFTVEEVKKYTKVREEIIV